MPKYKLPKKPGQFYFYYKPGYGIPLYGKNLVGKIRDKYFFQLMTYMNNYGHLDRGKVFVWCHVVKSNPDPENIMELINKYQGGK